VPTGLNVLLGVNANVLSSALPTGAATAANQEVTAASMGPERIASPGRRR